MTVSNVNTYVVAYSPLRCRKYRRENRRQINRTTTVANVTEALSLKFLSGCARSEGSGESTLLARAISYNFHGMGELANENLILIA